MQQTRHLPLTLIISRTYLMSFMQKVCGRAGLPGMICMRLQERLSVKNQLPPNKIRVRIQKSNTPQTNRIPLILVAFAWTFSFLVSGCGSDSEVKKYKTLEPELAGLLDTSRFQGKTPGKYLLSSILAANDPVFQKLLKEGIVNAGSFVMYSSADCLSLTTRIKENGDAFTDRVVINNGNEGKFACNINDLYTLNQDEKVNRLDIKVGKISSSLMLFTIGN
jgi:hypothetical protein